MVQERAKLKEKSTSAIIVDNMSEEEEDEIESSFNINSEILQKNSSER
jgi:hypothetical protein